MKPWMLRLICCGRDDGYEAFDTWGEANTFRESYMDAGGHERAAILTKTQWVVSS